jgi:hypothetical protein
MEDELRPFVGKHKISVTRQYIDNEPTLEKLYGMKVPVLTLNNETLCEYFLDAELLTRVIRSKVSTK